MSHGKQHVAGRKHRFICSVEVAQLLAGRHASRGIPLKTEVEYVLGMVELEVALRDSEMIDVPNAQVLRKASNIRC